MSKREGRHGTAGSARATHGDKLRPRFVPTRETMKRVSSEAPSSVSDDLGDYIEFVAEATGLGPETTAGEILVAALREYFQGRQVVNARQRRFPFDDMDVRLREAVFIYS